MYEDYETPEFSASIFYYDIDYQPQLAEQVLQILEKYNLYPPVRLHADKLTGGRFKKYKPSMRNILIDAYAEKDVLGVVYETEDTRVSSKYCTVFWTFTFHKMSHLNVKEPKFRPWNVFTINASHEWMRDKKHYAAFMNATKELIAVISPFYANIDDVSQCTTLLRRAGENRFVPDRIQQVYWGNYWGESFERENRELESVAVCYREQISNGTFFTLSDTVFDSWSSECDVLRSQILKKI